MGVAFTSDMRRGEHVNNMTDKAINALSFHQPKPSNQFHQNRKNCVYGPGVTNPGVCTAHLGTVCSDIHQENRDGTMTHSEICHQPVPWYNTTCHQYAEPPTMTPMAFLKQEDNNNVLLCFIRFTMALSQSKQLPTWPQPQGTPDMYIGWHVKSQPMLRTGAHRNKGPKQPSPDRIRKMLKPTSWTLLH